MSGQVTGQFKCQLCSGSLEAHGTTPGYVDGLTYEVFQCTGCESQKAEGESLVPGLYEAIYENADSLPGYYRYARSAAMVSQVRDPLKRLGRTEDVYWAVDRIIGRLPRGAEPLRVLDVGCGLGYLTASLRKRGVDALGVDHSETAVQSAADRFGPWFKQGDVGDAAFARSLGHFDFIIGLEIIEHLLDPADLLRSMEPLLNDEGALIISTPNRSNYPKEATWATDLPPVHLHWISERGLRECAGRLSLAVDYVDFSRFNMTRPGGGTTSHGGQPFKKAGPILSAELQPLQHVEGQPSATSARSHLLNISAVGSFIDTLRVTRNRFRGVNPSRMSSSMVAAISRC